jgi:2-keto-4-pentenoate hydratase/2-oxohepta-3-ene-1,7-dioic acid hydratase in catechol pathway
VLSPGTIHALGLTYRDHAAETGERIDPSGPAVFARDPASRCVPGRILIPSRARVLAALERLEPGLGSAVARRFPHLPALLDYEVELGVIIGDGGRVGYVLANDITARTVQILGEGAPDRMAFWSAAKSFPGTLLLGATVVWSDKRELPDVPLELRVNGAVRQRSRTSSLVYTLDQMIAFASRRAPVGEGDLLLTGTPGGIALAVPRWKRAVAGMVLSRLGRLGAALRSRRRFLAAGDIVEMDGGPLGRARAVVEEEA